MVDLGRWVSLNPTGTTSRRPQSAVWKMVRLSLGHKSKRKAWAPALERGPASLGNGANGPPNHYLLVSNTLLHACVRGHAVM